MKNLARHIELLLRNNDCVILPGFGGFIAHDVPAYYVSEEGLYYPPSRSISFNAAITMNDGLLVQSYMKSYQVDYARATYMVDVAVEQLTDMLDEEQCKINNQASVLHDLRDEEVRCMRVWARDVRSGDAENMEARAAAHYWKYLFGQHIEGFTRDRDGVPPNNLLNYGYAILRAIIARALVASGLLPTLGIHHHNRYNAYCLADDIMEPYRPYVDELVYKLVKNKGLPTDGLTREWKAELLVIPTLDVIISGKRSPLMIAAGQTTASLYKCFSGELRKIAYPER